MLTKNKAELQNFADAIQFEFLETNGLGGWSGSSIIGANTRRYHGLLVAATVPPTERTVLLSKLEETIVTGQARYQLGVNLYPGPTVHPNGYHYLNSFKKELFPEWEFEADGIKIKKTVAMVHGENTVLVLYDVLEAPQDFTLELLPLVAARGYHTLAHEGPHMHWHVDFEEGVFHTLPDGKTDLYIQVPGATYEHSPKWFRDFQYPAEQYRGLDYSEDLFNHGSFTVELKQGDSLGVIISTENPGGRIAHELFTRESMRRQLLVSHQPDDMLFRELVLAADQFIVKRSEDLKTIIAGYHWFTDWGRDTMISLPGLCLSTGRFEDAKKILSAFARSVSQGMLPNRFREDGEEPEYNNVDGTLWFFIAVNKYLEATGDRQFVLGEILPVLKDIIDWHYHGTRYNIRVADDGLLFAGQEGQQLTWMDARIGSWVVTPRMGKPVEIQALWYNALKIFADLLELNGQADDGGMVNMAAERVRRSFNQQYWYVEGNYLYDNINENGDRVPEFRPNQLFAISLPYPLIEGDKAMVVLQQVTEHLYTPVGLKTLPRNDKNYVPVYGGDQYHRDSAYHEGTAWSWLLGPFVDAIMKVQGNQGKAWAQQVIDNFAPHLNDACIGTISEIFDADPPHHPRGCVAQAWSVGEILRVIKDYQLFTPKLPKAEVKLEAAEA
jgi:predicted glycogen debranching enzyme